MTWDRGASVLPTTHQFMDAEQYFQLPEGPPYFQLIAGELFMAPSPEYQHQRISGILHSSLFVYLEDTQLGEVIHAPSDVQLDAKNVFQPDLYFIRKERRDMLDKQGPKEAPDLVVEILSGSTARLDLGPKKKVYEESGVGEFWVIAPREKQVRVFRLDESFNVPALVFSEGEVLRSNLFPGWGLPLAKLFRSM